LAYNKKKGNKNRNVIIKNKIIIRYNLNDPNNLLRFQIGIPLLPENYKPEKFN